MDGTRCFGPAVECDCWWRGVNLYFYRLGTATNVSSMEDSETLGRYIDNESILLKIIFISILKAPSSGTSANPCFPLWRAYLFTFMSSTFIVESSSSHFKHQS